MTQPFDYTDSAPLDMELIPAGEVAVVQMRIRTGGDGEDGVLKRSKEGTSSYLDAEFILLEGKHSKMKFWQNFLLTGETDGQKQMVAKSQSIMKAMLDSAFAIRPDDKTNEARTKRSKVLLDFDGLKFQIRVGVEKGGKRPDGTMYRDRNVLGDVINPDKTGYRGPFDQDPPSSGGPPPAPPTSPVTKPAWAT